MEFAGELIGTDAVHGLRAEEGSDLILFSDDFRENSLYRLCRDVLVRKEPVDLLLEVV